MPSKRPGVTAASARRMLLAFPGVEEGTSYGLPAFKIRGTFFARMRDGDLVVHLRSFTDRDYLLESDPGVFYTTDHYRNHPTVLVRLARIRAPELRAVLTDAWSRGQSSIGNPKSRISNRKSRIR